MKNRVFIFQDHEQRYYFKEDFLYISISCPYTVTIEIKLLFGMSTNKKFQMNSPKSLNYPFKMNLKKPKDRSFSWENLPKELLYEHISK